MAHTRAWHCRLRQFSHWRESGILRSKFTKTAVKPKHMQGFTAVLVLKSALKLFNKIYVVMIGSANQDKELILRHQAH